MNIDLKTISKSVSLSLLTLLLTVTILYGATTIGANIDTAGTLLVNNATSTITNLVTVNATSTNATTTAFYATGLVDVTGSLRVNNATSTITNLVIVNSTTTTATTTRSYVTNHFVGGKATTTSAGNISTLTKAAVGTTTVDTNELTASGSATTTLNLFSDTANQGSCIQLSRGVAAGNTVFRIYISGTGTLITEAGACK